MRKRTSQLTRLIWDFYRENYAELKNLKLLAKCQVFRRWGVLHIRCWNQEIANGAIAAVSLIAEPIVKLRIAREIKVSVRNTQIAIFPIGESWETMPNQGNQEKERKGRRE